MQPDSMLFDWGAILNRVTRVLVVVDVVESVRLMHADEFDTIDRWRRLTAEVRHTVLPAHQGRLVKSLGDGLLLEFEHMPAALAAAFDIQRAVAPYNQGRSADRAMHLRVGLHLAEVVVDELDVYGAGVNLAARLAGLAGPGEVVVSAAVKDHAVPGLDAEFEDMGWCFLKHLDEPVQAYRARPVPWARSSDAPLVSAGAEHLEHLESREYRPSSPQPDASTQARPVSSSLRPALAVMPLQVVAPSSAMQAALGELWADALIARLAGADSLRVISRLSTTALAHRACTVADIGQRLGAAWVLSGHVVVQTERLMLHIELAEAHTEVVVWAERLHTTVDALMAPDSPVIGPVSESLVQHITQHTLRRVQHQPLPTLESFSLQLAGMALMHRSTRHEFDQAKQVLDHLADRHPRAPEPRAWLAKWYVLRVTRQWVQDLPQESARALDHTQRALDVSPDCSLAWAMAGFVHCHMRQDLNTAEQTLQQALRINPSNSLAWLFLCVVQGFVGQGREALASADQAIALSPLDPLRHYYDGLACSAALAAGELDKAIQWGQRSLQINRAHLPTLRALAIAQVESGRLNEAHHTVKQLLSLDPGLTIQRYVASAPPAAAASRQRYAQALREAGVPSN